MYLYIRYIFLTKLSINIPCVDKLYHKYMLHKASFEILPTNNSLVKMQTTSSSMRKNTQGKKSGVQSRLPG